MKRLSEKRLYELSQWSHRKLGVNCPICGAPVTPNKSNKLCGLCAFEFGRDYPKLIIDGKTYEPLPNTIFGCRSIDDGYIIVYRKYYELVRYDETVINMKSNKQRFSTYNVIGRNGGYLTLKKGNVDYWKYQDDDCMYRTTRFVAQNNKEYQGAIL